ncbi:MAG: cupredoxin domain-containing protein [Armatimonadota bacterium]|nr:cupredoxin domain-containing protein [Armatimonadota bacterium]MDR7402006.1 cupredoxin domain-containing protein [Armatimonadota bacterium]MDR7404223.1 cupredoxin domain-containing protein [Armatimonadota bacterium]MDR7437973.1 cupredoxin domain-containing protein [Armatimonadota bacterium]MDR7473099.1 cupredoxin domain-containing protein [Armatimonadota bacterium]
MRRCGTLVAAAVAMGVALGPAAAAPKQQKVTVTLTEFKFTPATVTLQAGVPAVVTLVNKGTVEHEFMVYGRPAQAVDDWDEYAMANTYFQGLGEVEVEFAKQGAVAGTNLFEVEVQPNRTATVVFTPTKKGTFEIGCHVEGHYEAGMKGTLVVK